MTRFRTILITMAAVATLSLAAPSSYAAVLGKDAQCLTDQQIQAAIQSGQIKSWPTIKKLAHISGEVSDLRVCRINGDLYYTANLVSSYGEAKKIVLNAVDGSG